MRKITRNAIQEQAWDVYLPSYVGSVLLIGRLYRALPHNREWPISHYSEIGLAADYLEKTRS